MCKNCTLAQFMKYVHATLLFARVIPRLMHGSMEAMLLSEQTSVVNYKPCFTYNLCLQRKPFTHQQ